VHKQDEESRYTGRTIRPYHIHQDSIVYPFGVGLDILLSANQVLIEFEQYKVRNTNTAIYNVRLFFLSLTKNA
jgi:hypothetical protein